MPRKVLFACLSFLFIIPVWAARIDTLQVKSASMRKEIEVIVISPAAQSKSLPVIYLLHGYGGNACSWLEIKPELTKIADKEKILFVCPDGKNSWYWDSPLNSDYRYETFIASELTEYIDSHYHTLPTPKGRAITGLSMGGHGAIWISFRHPDIFGAVGSTSGGLDIRPFPEKWNIKNQLGEKTENNRAIWDTYTAINQIGRIKNKELAILIDCGYEDFFFSVNNQFHQKLMERKIEHDFIVRPGGHTSAYWNNSIDYQILFFKKFFEHSSDKGLSVSKP